MPTAEFPEGRIVEIRFAGCLLILGERELIRMLNHHPRLWMAAMRRGKAVLRRRKARERFEKAGHGDALLLGERDA